MTCRKLLTVVAVMSTTLGLIAQTNENKEPEIVLHGFVRADAAFDSRLNAESREGFFIFYPLKPKLDVEGNDLNQVANFNQWGMTTRLNLTAKGPQVLGAVVKAFIEGDFTGPSNSENNAFRLRHGYVEMKWEKTSIMAGQYWSPLDVPEMLPRVLALNTGAPFRSFTRSPLVKFEYFPGKLKMIAVAYAQRDYPSPGTDGSSQNYLRNGLIPNLHLQLQYCGNKIFSGLGIDYKQLRPRLVTDSLVKANELVRSIAFHAFTRITLGKFEIKTQAIAGQNLSDHLMLGGYAVKTTDSLDHRTYVNLWNVAAWADMTYEIKKWRLGLFTGYTKNMGTQHAATNLFYGRGNQIDYVYRIAPRFEANFKPVFITLEMEYTGVGYGTPDDRYKLSQITETGNIRLQTAVVYQF